MESSADVTTLTVRLISTFVRPYGPSTQVDIGMAARIDTRLRTTSSVGFVYLRDLSASCSQHYSGGLKCYRVIISLMLLSLLLLTSVIGCLLYQCLNLPCRDLNFLLRWGDQPYLRFLICVGDSLACAIASPLADYVGTLTSFWNRTCSSRVTPVVVLTTSVSRPYNGLNHTCEPFSQVPVKRV